MSQSGDGGHHYVMNLVPVLRHQGHTLDATLLRLGRRAWDTSSADAAECEEGEDNQQNKNDRRALHLLIGEKIT